MSQHCIALPIHDTCALQNVLLDTECMTAKLADVGLARLIDNTSTRTNSSHLHGWTLAYAAPVRPLSLLLHLDHGSHCAGQLAHASHERHCDGEVAARPGLL